MGWKVRLQQLLLAGGSLAASACSGGTCNGGVSFPCCADPKAVECQLVDAGVPDLEQAEEDLASGDGESAD